MKQLAMHTYGPTDARVLVMYWVLVSTYRLWGIPCASEHFADVIDVTAFGFRKTVAVERHEHALTYVPLYRSTRVDTWVLTWTHDTYLQTR